MREIPLVNSTKKATVDDEDYEYISQFDWYLTKSGYSCRFTASGFLIYMHDEIWARFHEDYVMPVYVSKESLN